MRNLIAFLVASTIFSPAAFAGNSTTRRVQAKTVDGFFASENLLSDGGFEKGGSTWTASGGTYTTTSTAANVGRGSKAGSWDSNAAAQTLVSETITIPAGMYGKNGVVSCSMLAGGTSTITLTANDGTNDLATAQTMTSSTSYFQRTSVNFIFPTSGSIKLKIASVASNEPVVYLDDCYLGLAEGFNIQQVSQGISILDATRITSSQSIGATSPVTVIYNSATYDPYSVLNTTTGVATMKKAGVATVAAQVGMTALDTQGFYLQVYKNGVGISGCTGYFVSGALGSGKNVVTPCSFAVAVGDTIEVRTSSDTDSAYTIINGLGSFNIRLDPLVSETALRPDQTNVWGAKRWTVTGSHAIGASAAASTTRTTATNAAWSTYDRFGQASNDSSQNIQVTLTLPAGDYSADFFGLLRANTPASGTSTGCDFEIWDGSAAVAITYVTSSTQATVGEADISAMHGIFNVPAQATKTYSLRAAKVGGGAVAGSSCEVATSSTEVYAGLVIKPVSMSIPATLLVGSVTSNSTGAERIERAYLTSACTVTSQSGSWIQGSSHTATGKCDLTVTGFSAVPDCTMVQDNSVAPLVHTIDITSTSTVIKTQHITTGSTFTDSPFHIICMGPK